MLKRRNSVTQLESDFSTYLQNGVILYLHHGDIYHGQVESAKQIRNWMMDDEDFEEWIVDVVRGDLTGPDPRFSVGHDLGQPLRGV